MHNNERPRRPRGPRGFSLLEIMVVITLIGLVTAVVSTSMVNAATQGQIDNARIQAKELAKSVAAYRLQRGRFPTMAEGLAALQNEDHGAPLVEHLPRDPWGKAYAYRVPGVHNRFAVDIYSAGPDGVFDTDDDVGNWKGDGDAP